MTATARILVTGGTGQVGIELCRQSKAVIAPTRAELDLESPQAIVAMVGSQPWTAVINAAAYTAVDRAERDVAAAWRLNAVAPAVIASETARLGIRMIQISTDYVFDGGKVGPYLPTDTTSPLSVYGASKLAGEIAVRSASPRHVVVRTSWVISAHRANFVKTMLRLGRERDRLQIVADQQGSPTSAADLAEALLMIAARLADPALLGDTWHFGNDGVATWHDLAGAIFAGAARRDMVTPSLEAIATADYPTPARRPANSRLDIATLTRDFGIVPRPWRAALDDILAELLDGTSRRRVSPA